MRTSPLLLLFVVLLFLPAVLFADEVFIKGAGSITGRIVDQTPARVVVDVGGGTVGIPMAKVDHIERGSTDLDQFDARAAKLAPWDGDGWRTLARWATFRGLEKQARRAYEQVLATVPDDPEAEGALGFVMIDGLWVTLEQAYRARGFVRFDGEWMLPAEAQLRMDQAAAEQKEREAAESARAEELQKLKDEVQAQYAAEAAADEEWRAEGAAWFYSHAYWGVGWGGWGGWGYTTPSWSASPCFHAHSWHRR